MLASVGAVTVNVPSTGTAVELRTTPVASVRSTRALSPSASHINVTCPPGETVVDEAVNDKIIGAGEVAVAGGVNVGDGVKVCELVTVALGKGVKVTVAVAVGVAVDVGVCVKVAVAVNVNVGEGVIVGVRLGVSVKVAVTDGKIASVGNGSSSCPGVQATMRMAIAMANIQSMIMRERFCFMIDTTFISI